MSEDERENGHNKKQKMESAVQEEEYKPILPELLSQMNTNLIIPQKNKNPRFPESASRSSDLLPLQHNYIEQGEEIPSSVAMEVDQNKPQSSNVAQGSKKVVLSKRKRCNLEIVEQLQEEYSIADSENDPDMDMDMEILILIDQMDTCLELNSEYAMEM